MRPGFFLTNLTCAAVLCALISALAPSAYAGPDVKNSQSKILAPRVGSLTPPPKEWAMFPQDDPPPQQGQAPQNGSGAGTGTGAGAAQGSVDQFGNVVAASNARPGRQRDLPIFWILVTGALCIGAATACGSLILREDEPQSTDEEGIPTVGEGQEVRA